MYAHSISEINILFFEEENTFIGYIEDSDPEKKTQDSKRKFDDETEESKKDKTI